MSVSEVSTASSNWTASVWHSRSPGRAKLHHCLVASHSHIVSSTTSPGISFVTRSNVLCHRHVFTPSAQTASSPLFKRIDGRIANGSFTNSPPSFPILIRETAHSAVVVLFWLLRPAWCPCSETPILLNSSQRHCWQQHFCVCQANPTLISNIFVLFQLKPPVFIFDTATPRRFQLKPPVFIFDTATPRR
jgi:hypothetical protein